MSKILVAYFSATGATAKLAQALASELSADLHEILPSVAYTRADLDWMDPKSRSSLEMKDKASRPAIANLVENMAQYDALLIGFPVWWYTAPRIINTFLEQYDLSDKTVLPFATSGSSGIGTANRDLAPSCRGAKLESGKRFPGSVNASELRAWAQSKGVRPSMR